VGGIDRQTGKRLSGWGHVAQSIEDIFTTRFGERVMREWYGSDAPRLLGENATVDTFMTFYATIVRGLTVREINGWMREPRFRLTQFDVTRVGRDGSADMVLSGLYIPRALYGDNTPEGSRTLTVSLNSIAGVL
jgi:phage baseplate assembly protein W